MRPRLAVSARHGDEALSPRHATPAGHMAEPEFQPAGFSLGGIAGRDQPSSLGNAVVAQLDRAAVF